MNFLQAKIWLKTTKSFVRRDLAKEELARLEARLLGAESLTAGVVVSALFITNRSPEIAQDLVAFHEQHLIKTRLDVAEGCWALLSQALAEERPEKRPAHRPVGSRPHEENDFPAAVFARILLLGSKPPSASKAIQQAVEFAEAAGSPVHCHSEESRARRLREYLNDNSDDLDHTLRKMGCPILENKSPQGTATSPQ